MGKKLDSIALKNRIIYKPVFDDVPTEQDKDDDDTIYYDEIIIYDGGGVSDFMPSKN